MRVKTAEGDLYLSSSDLLVNTIIEGASGAGKTVFAAEAVCTVLDEEPGVGVLVIDGGRTLSRRLVGRSPRVVYVPVDNVNSSGFAVDMTRLLPGETVLDRTLAIMASVSFQRHEAEMFSLVAASGSAAIGCLVAARRPISQLTSLILSPSLSFWRELKKDIVPEANAVSQTFVDQCIAYMDEKLLKDHETLKPDREIEAIFGSTYRAFLPFIVTVNSYFERPTVDLHAELAQGACVVLDMRLTDPRTSAMVKRFFYGLSVLHAQREISRLLTVCDELDGHDFRTYMGTLAVSRNLGWASWFCFQNPDQVGEDGSHYDRLLSIAKTVFAFRPQTYEHALDLARMRGPDGEVYLPTRSVTASIAFSRGKNSDTGENTSETFDPLGSVTALPRESNGWSSKKGKQKGRSFGISIITGKERMRLDERLQRDALDLTKIPAGYLLVVRDGQPTVDARFPMPPHGEQTPIVVPRPRTPAAPPAPPDPPRPPKKKAPGVREGAPRPSGPEAPPAPSAPAPAGKPVVRRGFDGPGDGPEREGTERNVPLDPPPSPSATIPAPNSNLDRVTTLLAWALSLRYPSVNDFILLTRAPSYDSVARALEELTTGDKPALDRFTPPAARGQGSTPAIYTLNAHGARRLAEAGQGDLGWMQNVARTVAKRRRDVEAGAATHLVHDTDVAHFAALVIRYIYDHDPNAQIEPFLWGSGFHAPLPCRDVLDRLPLKYHELVGRDDVGQTGYWPDVFLAVRWRPDGVHLVSEAFALEVETGFSGADGQAKGAVRAAKVGVIQKIASQTGKLGSLHFPIQPRLRVLTWARTPEFEAGLIAGTQRVQRASKNDLWFTNMDLLPLTVAKGTVKKNIPTALREMSAQLNEEIWSWIRYPQTRSGLWEEYVAARVGETPGMDG